MVADDLTPSETVQMDKEKILAVAPYMVLKLRKIVREISC